MDSLTTRDRLRRLKYYFDVAPQKHIFIYQIRGLKGHTEITVGDVTFYWPKFRQYVSNKSETLLEDETFGADDEFVFMNAAVEISYLDTAVGERVAREKIEEALDVLGCYLNSEITPEVNINHSIRVDDRGRIMGSHMIVSDNTEWKRWIGGLTLDKDFFDQVFNENLRGGLNEVLKKPSNQHNEVEHTIARSLHWFRKGKNAHKLEDELLNYWVTVEKLLPNQGSGVSQFVAEKHEKSTLTFAREVIATNEALSYVYGCGWDLFHVVRNLVRSRAPSPEGFGPKLRLPDNLIEASGLTPTDNTFRLEPFIKSLDEIVKYSSKRLLTEKINKVINFYSSPEIMVSSLDNVFRQVQDDVTLLYWYRNKIIHDAHFDYTILPFYIPRARSYSGLLLKTVIRSFCEDKRNTVDEILLLQFLKFHRICERLRSGEKIDVFKLNL